MKFPKALLWIPEFIVEIDNDAFQFTIGKSNEENEEILKEHNLNQNQNVNQEDQKTDNKEKREKLNKERVNSFGEHSIGIKHKKRITKNMENDNVKIRNDRKKKQNELKPTI